MGFLGRSKESKNIERQGADEYTGIGNRFNRYYDDQLKQRGGAENRSNQAYDKILAGYDTANGAFDDLDGIYRDWSNTGGIDPDDYNYSRSRYHDLVNTGGMTDENRSRIRGNGVFDEFAKTGGWSPERIAQQRLRASATGSSMYEGLKGELDRQRAASGGQTPGDVYGGSQERLTRDSARGADEASLASELGMAGAIDEGRRYGASSLSNAESRLVGQESSNKLGGLGGLSNLYGLRQAGREFGTSGLGQTAGARASLLDTLRQTRADVPGEVGMYNQNLLESLGLRGQQTEQNLQGRRQYTPNRGFLDNLASLGQVAAPFFGAFSGGAGNILGSGSKGNPNFGSNNPLRTGTGQQAILPPSRRLNLRFS